MTMDAFTFKRAATVKDAVAAAIAGADAKFLAGGQTLLPVMKQRLAAPTDIISLARVPELAGITLDGGTISIGAMTRHADVAAHAGIKQALPALAVLAGGIADPHVRNRGTIGGSLANNDPAADYPAAVLGLGAKVVTDRRRIAADDFFQGMFTTALEPGELITRIEFPIPDRAGYIKLPHPASRYALVGVMVSQTQTAARVAVTGAGASVFRVPAMEQALGKAFTMEAIADITVPHGDLTSDRAGSAAYRAHLITVLAKRAVARALEARS
jgi:aerobic carbon-monoxide dehydrogenase medium subunit